MIENLNIPEKWAPVVDLILDTEKFMMIAWSVVYSIFAFEKYARDYSDIRSRLSARATQQPLPPVQKEEKTYDFLPEELLPESLKSQRQTVQEKRNLEDLVRARLAEHGDLRESRLWYVTREQSVSFARMTLDESRDRNSNGFREMTLLEDVLATPDFKSVVGNGRLDVIDIGCGNGEKAKKVIEHCEQVNYVPIDISPYMIAIAVGNVCNRFGSGEKKHYVPSLLARVTTPFVSPLLVRYSIFNKRNNIKRQRRRLKRLLGDKKLKKYLDHIEHDAGIIDKVKALEGIVDNLAQADKTLRDISRELRKCDKKRLLEIHYNVIGANFSLLNQITTAFDDTFGMSLLFYPARFFEFATIFWPGVVMDYAVGKLTNFRVSEDAAMFSPYYFDSVYYGRGDKPYVPSQADVSSRIYALRQSMRSVFWPSKERVSQQLEKIITAFNKVTDLSPKKDTTNENDEKLCIPADHLIRDFSHQDIARALLNLTFKYEMYNNQRLYLFLGQTLGNFDARERRDVVDKFYDAMSSGDLMLVGVELRPDESSAGFEDHLRLMERNYAKGSDFLAPILHAAGIDANDVEYQAVYNKATNQVEIDYRVITDKVVVAKNSRSLIDRLNGRKEESRVFGRGELIPVAASHKFAVNEVRSLFEHAGFSVVGHKTYTPLRSSADGAPKESHPEYEVLLVRK